jgi:hypothetical protein
MAIREALLPAYGDRVTDLDQSQFGEARVKYAGARRVIVVKDKAEKPTGYLNRPATAR